MGNVRLWAMTRLISKPEANGNFRASLPVVAMPAGRNVGTRSCRSRFLPMQAIGVLSKRTHVRLLVDRNNRGLNLYQACC